MLVRQSGTAGRLSHSSLAWFSSQSSSSSPGCLLYGLAIASCRVDTIAMTRMSSAGADHDHDLEPLRPAKASASVTRQDGRLARCAVVALAHAQTSLSPSSFFQMSLIGESFSRVVLVPLDA
jgi:hypothetical protein